MFADDIANCAETAIKLKQQIDTVDLFCQNTGMQLNVDTTKIIVFRNGGPLRGYENWFYRGTRIESVSFYRYMGLLFTPKLKWTRTKLHWQHKLAKRLCRFITSSAVRILRTYGRFQAI